MPVTTKNLAYTWGDKFSFDCLAQDYNQNVINLTGAEYFVRAGFAGTGTVMDATISNIVPAAGTFTASFAETASHVFPNSNVELDYLVQVLPYPIGTARYTIQAGKIYLTPAAF